MRFNKPLIITLATVAELFGCSFGPTVLKPDGLSQQEAFSKGTVRLNCASVGCAMKSGTNLRDMDNLSQTGRWVELSELVMGIGFPNNNGYYYLGRAAEGLNYLEAAKTYYLLSSGASMVNSNGFGHDLNKEVPERLSQIDGKLKEATSTPIQISAPEGKEVIPAKLQGDSSSAQPLIFDEINEVAMTKNGGVYMVPASINDVLTIKFILDSGAADVSISPDIALTLLKTDTITKNDFLPGQAYKLADGSIAQSDRFRIRSLKIGTTVLKNVPCSIANSLNAPLLLGQSALEQLGSFTFDYGKGVVRFQNKLAKSK